MIFLGPGKKSNSSVSWNVFSVALSMAAVRTVLIHSVLKEKTGKHMTKTVGKRRGERLNQEGVCNLPVRRHLMLFTEHFILNGHIIK